MHAEPLVDSPGTVIDKLLDYYEKNTEQPSTVNRQNASGSLIKFDTEKSPDLTHTRVLAANIGGLELENPNWNRIVYAAHAQALKGAKNSILLAESSTANVAIGRKEDEGYRYLPELSLSIQGQDSNSAWESIVNLAKEFDFPIEVRFKWRDRKESAYPGEVGYMIWEPK